MTDTTPADQARTAWPTAQPLQQAADIRRAAGDPLMADWLDATANALAWLAPYRDNEPGYAMWEAALAVARQILATATTDTGAQADGLRDRIAVAVRTVPIKYGDGTIEPVSADEAAVLTDAVMAVLPAGADRADLPDRLQAVLTERFTALGNPFSEMRTQEEGPDGWPASHPVSPNQVAEVLRELMADAPARQVLGTTTGQPETETPATPATLTTAERTFLTFALDLAFAEMVSNDGFTDEDHAALDRLRRLAAEAQQPTPAP